MLTQKYFYYLTDLNYEATLDYFYEKIGELSKSDWWEVKCQIIIIFAKIIKGIINSPKYFQYIKQGGNKQFNNETEQLINKIKAQLQDFSTGIKILAYPPQSEAILRITFIYIIDLIKEQNELLELFVNLLLISTTETRNWVLYSQNPPKQQQQEEILDDEEQEEENSEEEMQLEQDFNNEEYLIYNDKSLKYQVKINSKLVKLHAAEILQHIIEMVKQVEVSNLTPPYLEIILYAFNNTDFKLLNIEICENIANSLKEYLFLSLCDEELCEQAKIVVQKLIKLKFDSDVRIIDAEKLLVTTICISYSNNNQLCIEVVEEIIQDIIQQADRGIESYKQFLIEIYNGIETRIPELIEKHEILKELQALSVQTLEKKETDNDNKEQDIIEEDEKKKLDEFNDDSNQMQDQENSTSHDNLKITEKEGQDLSNQNYEDNEQYNDESKNEQQFQDDQMNDEDQDQFDNNQIQYQIEEQPMYQEESQEYEY